MAQSLAKDSKRIARGHHLTNMIGVVASGEATLCLRAAAVLLSAIVATVLTAILHVHLSRKPEPALTIENANSPVGELQFASHASASNASRIAA